MSAMKPGNEVPAETAGEKLDDYTRGLLDGVDMYAWWKDGTAYVGTCGTTLREARERIIRKALAALTGDDSRG